jgi:hypothetical protein
MAVSALVPLLPSLDGWTKQRASSDLVVVPDACRYAFADAIYTNGTLTVRVTVADTGFDESTLVSLATMVMTLPDTYNEVIPPSTAATRFKYKDSPAATLWDTQKRDGEFVVVVGKRFVLKAAGSSLASLDVLRAFVDAIDLRPLTSSK